MRELIPELLAAFDRLFVDPVERDTQCWAKNAIAKALTELDYRESAPFLRGSRHIQMEAVWGGRQDTAQTLRGICLLALASCNDMPRAQILRLLVDAMADEAQTVRVEAVRAVAEMDGEEAALVLRLKARVGDREAPVIGQVFDSLLRLERDAALPLVAEFLGRRRRCQRRSRAGAGIVADGGRGGDSVQCAAARARSLLPQDGVASDQRIAAREGDRVSAGVGEGRHPRRRGCRNGSAGTASGVGGDPGGGGSGGER